MFETTRQIAIAALSWAALLVALATAALLSLERVLHHRAQEDTGRRTTRRALALWFAAALVSLGAIGAAVAALYDRASGWL